MLMGHYYTRKNQTQNPGKSGLTLELQRPLNF